MALRYRSVKVGDTLGLLQYQMLDQGQTFPITGASVLFRMIRDDDKSVVVDDAVGILVAGADDVLGSDGVAAYQRLPIDVAVDGLMLCEFQVTVASGRIHKSPNIQLLIAKELP